MREPDVTLGTESTRPSLSAVPLFGFDKADVAVAFEPHIFFEMVFGNVLPEHVFPLQPAVLHEHYWFPLTQDPKGM